MTDLTIEQDELENEVVYLKLSGFLDAHSFEQLEEELENLFEQNRYRLVFDLDDLEYISSAGAGVFIGAIGTARENQGKIVLLSPNKNVKEVFDLLGLTEIFPFADSTSKAVEEVQAPE